MPVNVERKSWNCVPISLNQWHWTFPISPLPNLPGGLDCDVSAVAISKFQMERLREAGCEPFKWEDIAEVNDRGENCIAVGLPQEARTVPLFDKETFNFHMMVSPVVISLQGNAHCDAAEHSCSLLDFCGKRLAAVEYDHPDGSSYFLTSMNGMSGAPVLSYSKCKDGFRFKLLAVFCAGSKDERFVGGTWLHEFLSVVSSCASSQRVVNDLAGHLYAGSEPEWATNCTLLRGCDLRIDGEYWCARASVILD